MRVFLLEKTTHDISDAMRYGELVVMFEQRPSVFDHKEFRSKFLQRLRKLKFDKRTDSFLCVGTSVPLLLSASFIIQECEWFHALMFHAYSQTYVTRTLGYEDLQ